MKSSKKLEKYLGVENLYQILFYIKLVKQTVLKRTKVLKKIKNEFLHKYI